MSRATRVVSDGVSQIPVGKYRAGEKGPQGLVLSSVTYWARTAF